MDAPKTEKCTESYYTRSGLNVGSSGMQGYRLEMEDSHVTVDMPSRADHTFLAVFDGYDLACFIDRKMLSISVILKYFFKLTIFLLSSSP